jgi:predicted ATPase/DNA-binding winged helix-turn-helix (wHTH) protein
MTIVVSKPRPQFSRVCQNQATEFPFALGPEAKEKSPANRTGDQTSLKAAPIDGARPDAILFGRFCLLLDRRELLADGLPKPLGNRALDVLIVLIEARGKLVSKDELLSRVWPSTTVEENNLQFQISILRKALGRDRGLIRTDSGRGYRFVGSVSMGRLAAPRDDGRAVSDQGAMQVWEGRDPPNNLPAPTSALVGREAELSHVADLVGANRLVTLVGAGGVGKTRLGIELARRSLPIFPDGVWVADLGQLSDPGLVPPAIGTAIGGSDPGVSLERLAGALSPKRLLLVLDNCERVIGAAAGIAETLMRACASLYVIATSREPLRAEGEWLHRVPPLDVPPHNAAAIEEVLRHSAAKLFIARTFAAEPSVQLDARIASATTKICRGLDGIPLAIELAATSAVVLGVEALASRLGERFSLLTDGRRTAPARHQTLRATLDWSHELLSEPERVILRCLSVFDGAFTIEEASTVAASGEIAALDVVRCLASLVAKSLVALDVGGPVRRHRLFETTRAYAMEKLTESGELEIVSMRLAERFCQKLV